jgi:hypothetical protein
MIVLSMAEEFRPKTKTKKQKCSSSPMETSNQKKRVETIQENGQLLKGHFELKIPISLIYQEYRSALFSALKKDKETTDKMKRVFTRGTPLVYTLH